MLLSVKQDCMPSNPFFCSFCIALSVLFIQNGDIAVPAARAVEKGKYFIHKHERVDFALFLLPVSEVRSVGWSVGFRRTRIATLTWSNIMDQNGGMLSDKPRAHELCGTI